MNERGTVGERLMEVIRHYNLNVNSFSKEIGLSGNTVIGRIVGTTDRAPSFAIMQKIAFKYPELNFFWILTGHGEMLVDNGQYHGEYVYYFRLESSAEIVGALSGDMAPTAILNIYGFKDSQFAFDVVGDSMAPRFNAGDVIICRKAKDHAILAGSAYLIVGEDFQLTRYVRSVDDKGTMKLGAENPKYPDIKMELSRINHLLAITGTITKETY